MYRNTSERGNYLKRVASHSTKPRANGLIDVPPNAQSLPVNPLLQQFGLLMPQFKQALDNEDLTDARALFKRMSWLRKRAPPETQEQLRLMYLPLRNRLRRLKHRRYKDWYEKRRNPEAW
jgi:hypothetical protein